jgi:hypothetical protein
MGNGFAAKARLPWMLENQMTKINLATIGRMCILGIPLNAIFEESILTVKKSIRL